MNKIIVFLLVFCFSRLNSQNYISEAGKKLIEKSNLILNDSSNTFRFSEKAFEILEISETKNSDYKSQDYSREEVDKINLDISLVQSVAYFSMTNEFLNRDSYNYGIQVLEKGIDRFKDALNILGKYKIDSVSLDKKLYEKNRITFKKLYDELFNLYCEYKMYRKKDTAIDINKILKKYFNEIKGFEIIHWLLVYL